MKTEVIAMRKDQLHRLKIVEQANEGYITVREAAEILGLSERQVQ